MRKTGDYWREIHRTAKSRSLEDLQLSTGRVVITTFLALIYLAIVWGLIGGNAASEEIGLKIAATLAPLIVLPILYLIRFVRAPVDLHEAAVREIGELQLKIENKSAIQAAINGLWKLRREGVQLRNKTLVEQDEVGPWQAQMKVWHASTCDEARKVSENLTQWLSVLDQMTQGTVVEKTNIIQSNPTYARDLAFMSEVLHRLQLFLERDLRWPKVSS